MSKRTFSFLIPMVAISAFSVSASAGEQELDFSVCSSSCSSGTGKDACFEYSGLVNRSESDAPFYFLQDFAGSIAYVDDTQFVIRAGLIADNSAFVYEAPNDCLNCDMDGTATGTCILDDGDGGETTVNAWSVGQRWLRAGVQAWKAFPPCGTQHDWEGTMKVCTIGQGNPATYGEFYSFSPHSYNTGSVVKVGSTCSSTFQSAWEEWGSDVPVTWDSGIQRLVIPLATHWHNRTGFPTGWQTTALLYSNASQDIDVWVENPLTRGLHGHSPNNCIQGHAWGWAETTPVTLAPSGSTTVDLFRDLDDSFSESVGVWHDSVAFVALDPVVAGLGAQVTVSANSSGSSVCSSISEQ